LIEDRTSASSTEALDEVYRLFGRFDTEEQERSESAGAGPPAIQAETHQPVTPTVQTGTAPTWRHRLAPLRRPTGYYLLSRAGVFFAALVAKWLFPKLHVISTMGSIWDGAWYLKIAQHGYPHRLFNEGDGNRWAFFPAFPAIIRGLSSLTGLSLADAAVLAAFIFGLTSALAIWLAVREVFGAPMADRAVLLYVFFPAAYVLSMAYTEGLFLTAAAACLFALSRRYWITASLFAVLGSLTRNFGIFLILCVVVAAAPVVWRERKVRPLVAVGVAPLGLLAFMAYSWSMVGTPLAFMTAQKYWQGAHFVWFMAPIWSLQELVSHGLHGLLVPQNVLAVGALVFAYVGMAILVRMHGRGLRMPACWWVFTIGTVLTAMSPFFPNSILRYTMAAFPLFVAFAWKLKPAWEGAVIGGLALAQGSLTIIVLIELVHPLPIPFYP
jgi:hypothetical protein